MTDKDVNFHLRVKGGDDSKRKVDKLAESTENLGKKTDQAGRKARTGGEKIGGMGDKAGAAKQKTSALATALGGMSAGIGTIVALAAGFIQFLKDWLSNITKINAAQKELVESTKGLDQAAKALASQANVMGTEGGLEGSREDVLTITKTGGTTIAMGGDVGVATHSAFGESGKRLTPEQLEIAGVVAGFAQRKDLNKPEAGQLVKLLSAMGVKTPDEARHRIQQLSTVQQASQAQKFGEFIGGATKAIVLRLAKEASVEGALSSYAKGLEIDTGDVAAEKMKQMAAHLQNEKILQAMGKEYGMSEMDVRNMPFDEQVDMFSGWVSKHAGTGAGDKYLVESGLTGDQLGVASTLYTEDMRAERAKFKGLAEGATAEQFDAEAKGYAKTVQGQIDALESLRERTEASATPETRMGHALIKVAEAEWGKMTAEGQVPWDIAPNPLIKDEVEREAYMMYQQWYNPMWDRLSKLPKDEKYRAIRKRLKLPHAGPAPWMRYTPSPQEVGELEFMMRAAETEAGITPPPEPAKVEAEAEIAPPPAAVEVDAEPAHGDNPEEFRKMYPSPMAWAKSLTAYPGPDEWAGFGKAYPEEMAAVMGQRTREARKKQDPWVDKLEERFLPPIEAEPEITPPPAPAKVEAEPAITPPPEPAKVEAEAEITPPPELAKVEAEAEITPPPELGPVPDDAGFERVPVGDPEGAASVVNIFNDYTDQYDYSINFFPRVGNPADLGIGPRFDPNE